TNSASLLRRELSKATPAARRRRRRPPPRLSKNEVLIMRFMAKHRYADVTPRKLRPLADLIRGKSADEAMEALRFLPNRGARLIESVLKSAVGNAEDRGVRDIDDLKVIESRIDGGPIMKRIQPRARGMAYPIKKRFSHIIVAVDDGRPETA